MANQQQQIAQIQNLIQAVESGDQQAQQALIQAVQQNPQNIQPLMQIAQQMGAQTTMQILQQFVQKDKAGAKLNYIKFLRGECPEGYEMQYFKNGGIAGCAKCKQAAEAASKMSAVDAFKCGRKMKAKKAACGTKVKEAKCGSKVKARKGEGGMEVTKNYTTTVPGRGKVTGTRKFFKGDPTKGTDRVGIIITEKQDTIPFINSGTSYDQYGYPEAKATFLKKEKAELKNKTRK